MLKIAVCDDEKYYLDEARKIILDFFADNRVDIYTFDKVFGCHDNFFDIVILDIEMPKVNGIEFAEYIRSKNKRTRIIFLTNYLEYATEVYDTEHTFYVLKKDAERRLPDALKKAVNQLKKLQNELVTVETVDSVLMQLYVEDMIYFERTGRVTIINTVDGAVRTASNFDELLKAVGSGNMIRCYRSYVVNMRYIKSFSGDKVILTDGTVLPVSRNYSKDLKENFINHVKDIYNGGQEQ